MTRQRTLQQLEQSLLTKLDNVNDALAGDVAILGPDQIRELAMAAEQVLRGGYGTCIDCSNDIPLARLRVKPEAIRCVACQQKTESSSLHMPYVRFAS